MAFAVLLAVIFVVAGAAYLLAGSGPDTEPPASAPQEATPSPADHRLTDAEAKRLFQELDVRRLRGLESRDADLAASAYVDGSPVERRIRRDISRLRRTGTRVDTDFETIQLRVTENTSEKVRLLQKVLLHPRFIDESGDEVGRADGPERQVIEWLLIYTDEAWLIRDAVVLQAGTVE